MTDDDLIARLRSGLIGVDVDKQAADRIESLEREVERRIEPEQVEKLIEIAEPIMAELYAAECAYRKEADARLSECEAQLSKAAEIVKIVADWFLHPEDFDLPYDTEDVVDDTYDDVWIRRGDIRKARAVLAEIDGGKDD